MSVNERRAEIIRILLGRRRETMRRLAEELNVSVSTIQRDILSLTVDEHYPIDTERGNGGGVILCDFRHPHRHIFSREQTRVLTELIDIANARQADVLRELIYAYS